MRVFYVIYIEDEVIRACLNAIRILCNPRVKTSAHLTVRGPYKTKIKRQRLDVLNELVHNSRIIVYGVDKFFEPNQNTVFLQCASPELPLVWKKRDYGYNPHITLYDGDSRTFAENLLRILCSFRFNFSFTADKLSPLVMKKGQLNFFSPIETNASVISSIIGRQFDVRLIDSMSVVERLNLIRKICCHLSQLDPYVFPTHKHPPVTRLTKMLEHTPRRGSSIYIP